MTQKNLTLGIANFNYADLYDSVRLTDLLGVFDESVKYHDADLYENYISYRNTQGADLSPEKQSAMLVQVAPYVGKFVAKLFNVEVEHQAQKSHIQSEIETIFTFKNEVVEKLGVIFKGQTTDDWKIIYFECGISKENK